MISRTPTLLGAVALCMMFTFIRCNPCLSEPSLVDGCPTNPAVTNFLVFISMDDIYGDFEDYCKGHDLCYRCGVTLGISQHDCDELAEQWLKYECTTKQYRRNECNYVADMLYVVARKHGYKKYNTFADTSMCNATWVAQCLQPPF